MVISFSLLTLASAAQISAGFVTQGWGGREKTMQKYLAEQEAGERTTIVASDGVDVAGYITIIWKAHYRPFQESGIPEIADFNVFIKSRGKGIGRALLEEAERLIAEKSPIAGLGVALLPDYGTAQRMYVQSGYVPDGRGVTYNNVPCKYGDDVKTDDDLVLWFKKKVG